MPISWLINRKCPTTFAILLTILVTMISHSQAQFGLIIIDDPVAELRLEPGISINSADLNNRQITALATNSGIYLYNANFYPLAQTHLGDNIQSVVWSPDSHQLALAYQSQVEIWNWDDSTNTLNLVQTIAANGVIYNISWSPNGQFIAGLSLEYVEINGFEDNYFEPMGRIILWNTEDWQTNMLPGMYKLAMDYLYPQRFAWNKNLPAELLTGMGRVKLEDEQLLSDGTPDSFAVIQINTLTDITFTELPFERIDTAARTLSLAWQPNGSLIAMPDGLGGVHLYDSSIQGSEVAKYSNHNAELIRYVDWNYNGTLLIADNLVIDVQNNQELGLFSTESGVIVAIWRDKGDYPYMNTILLVERSGRVTIQDIHVFPNYIEPTPTNFTPAETPEPSSFSGAE